MIRVLCLFIYSMVIFSAETGSGTHGRNGDLPDEEADQKTDFEDNLFPVPESKGIFCYCIRKTDIENIKFSSRFDENTRFTWAAL